ncbi:large subunit ribosomal protein L17e [Strigomonas culicis]|uniref:Large subunit ribosomal protein L17e n=1 Tax=Strigomonas culicis TaxID=28005 RepID=S9WEP2_9TRYP|nr:large subunit ribosomal protein L17e [Strigomonas culicis]EPY34180.1 large subunit ribosomal protein L17e [Strigomonas culicis]|eukprot:EPY25951.1 large subunit ribosomal protein L17e [Strigomonas culicis]
MQLVMHSLLFICIYTHVSFSSCTSLSFVCLFVLFFYSLQQKPSAKKERKEMVHYSRKPQVSSKSSKAKVSDLRCHYKNTYETANVINGMSLRKAQQLYRQVLAKTRCIPFKHYNGKTGRTAQAKEWGQTKGRWPRKSVVAMLSLLKNAEANAIEKGLDANKMVIKHVQVDQAARMRRRTFRAHGRIGPYMCSPCHVQLFMSEKKQRVPAPKSAPKK